MTVPDHILQARERQREELLRLGLRPRIVPRRPQAWPPDWRDELIRGGEDPDYVEVWEDS